jgi:hypothetical protein
MNESKISHSEKYWYSFFILIFFMDSCSSGTPPLVSHQAFFEHHSHLKNGEALPHHLQQVRGQLITKRIMSKKLAFLEIREDGETRRKEEEGELSMLQLMIQYDHTTPPASSSFSCSSASSLSFASFSSSSSSLSSFPLLFPSSASSTRRLLKPQHLRLGDTILCIGSPIRTKLGRLSLLVDSLQLLSRFQGDFNPNKIRLDNISKVYSAPSSPLESSSLSALLDTPTSASSSSSSSSSSSLLSSSSSFVPLCKWALRSEACRRPLICKLRHTPTPSETLRIQRLLLNKKEGKLKSPSLHPLSLADTLFLVFLVLFCFCSVLLLVLLSVHSKEHDPCDPFHATKLKKSLRAELFADWLLNTYGYHRLNSGTGVLDVAGGLGHLTYALSVNRVGSLSSHTSFLLVFVPAFLSFFLFILDPFSFPSFIISSL